MSIRPEKSIFAKQSPPSSLGFSLPQTKEEPKHDASPKVKRDGLAPTLLALLGAVSALTGTANAGMAAEPADVIETQSDIDLSERVNVGDVIRDQFDSYKDFGDKVRERLDPGGVFDTRTGTVGDYQLSFEPLDIGIKPRWKDGGPALRLRGDFLDTSLVKSEDLGNDWTRTGGYNFRIRGELSTYQDPTVDISASTFRSFSGPIWDDYRAQFQTGAGLNYRAIGENAGLTGSLGFRQVVEGGSFDVFGQDFSLHAEATQNFSHNFDSGDSHFGYRAIAGGRTQVGLRGIGLPAELDIIAGPQIKGSTNGDAFDAGLGFRVRVNFD